MDDCGPEFNLVGIFLLEGAAAATAISEKRTQNFTAIFNEEDFFL